MFSTAIRNYLAANGYDAIKLHTAMFDMDGVLFDSMKNHARSWHAAMAHFGLDLPYEEAFLHEGRTGASTINIVMQRQRGRVATEQEVREIYAFKSQLFNSCQPTAPMDGALQLLQGVKASGVVPMVVTGSGQKSLLSRLQSNFPDIFQAELIVTAFDVKFGKPNPEPYLMGLRKSGSRPQEAIVVENAPLGVQAAVAASVFTIGVNTGPLPDSALLDAGAHLLFPSMQALAEAWPRLFAAFQTVQIPH